VPEPFVSGASRPATDALPRTRASKAQRVARPNGRLAAARAPDEAGARVWRGRGDANPMDLDYRAIERWPGTLYLDGRSTCRREPLPSSASTRPELDLARWPHRAPATTVSCARCCYSLEGCPIRLGRPERRGDMGRSRSADTHRGAPHACSTSSASGQTSTRSKPARKLLHRGRVPLGNGQLNFKDSSRESTIPTSIGIE
jgi:hypothetical protein